jgi:fructose-1,6-bisphosphatase/inositol monophosphatase family enzyme
MARVASGQALIATDRGGTPWDIAPTALLVEEAGGRVSDLEGNAWMVDSKVLVATNRVVHNEVIAAFNH